MENSSSKMDQVKELPQDIRSTILSLLPYHEAVVASVLSTTWRYDWLNLCSINIDQNFHNVCKSYAARKSNNSCQSNECQWDGKHYLDFLDDTLMLWVKNNHNRQTLIPNLNLDLSPINSKAYEPYIASFLNKLKVKNLVLDLGIGHISDELMEFFLATQVLTELTLRNVGALPRILPGAFNPSSCLRKLSLYYVRAKQNVIDNVFGNGTTSVIECLMIERCVGFKYLKLFKFLKLKELHLSFNTHLERIEIDKAPSFHYLYYKARHGWLGASLLLLPIQDAVGKQQELITNTSSSKRKPVIVQCSQLKELDLHDCDVIKKVESPQVEILRVHQACYRKVDQLQMDFSGYYLTQLSLVDCRVTDNWLDQHLSGLASLKVLMIERSHELNYLQMSLKHLVTFSIKDCQMLNIVEMDCPKLSNFKYESSVKSDHRRVCLLKGPIGAPNCLEIYINQLTCWLDQGELIILLNKIKTGEGKYFVPLGEVKHLKLTVDDDFDLSNVGACMKKMLWLCSQLERIQLISLQKKEISTLRNPFNVTILFKYKHPPKMNCGGYSSIGIDCWWHSIKDIVIEDKSGIEDEDVVLNLITSFKRELEPFENANYCNGSN